MSSRPLRGANPHERLADAFKRSGLTIKEVADLMGVNWPAASAWQKGRTFPEDPVRVRRLAEVLKVTADELLGMATGQEPPFEAWGAFMATPDGQSMDKEEQIALRSIAWPTGKEPTVAIYTAYLALLRSAPPRT